jgi:siderophore synthetase component
MKQEPLKNAKDLAARYTGHSLLNCYCREIAGPNKLLFFIEDSDGDHYQRFFTDACPDAEGILILNFPFLALRLLVLVDKPSRTHNYRFLSDVLVLDITPDGMSNTDASDRRTFFCEALAWSDIPELILGELAKRFGLEGQPELLAQIYNSREMLELILGYHCSLTQLAGFNTANFLSSERSLLFGHSFHPAPKSRQGFNAEELVRYSPEFHSSFQLHYFAVSPECFRLFAAEPVDFSRLFQQSAGIPRAGFSAEWPLIPCHPWQANYLLALPAVAKALRDEKLVYLGARGVVFSPTASVRTLFNQEFPYFVKTSLSLRITNSVRKNAYYELESAVAISRLLKPVTRALKRQFSGFSLLPEPVAATVDLSDLEDRERLDIQSHFGVILRENIQLSTSAGLEPLLAGTVFGDDINGQSNARFLIQQFRLVYSDLNEAEATIAWFEQYVKQLLSPVLCAFFEHGVAFEPHLQNVLLVIEDHAVAGIMLRDLEGAKLDQSRWPLESLPSMSDKARASVYHSRDLAWRRVVYCLFINNLCQAIFHCSRETVSEAILWDVVRRELESYRMRDASELCQELLGSILTGEYLPGKANLITRFMRQADSDSHYIDIPNPLLFPAARKRQGTPNVGALSL